ncbi:RSE1 [Candida jiufengensis]|uniref:RSE1 n=1 Tax=Candida jiufengensis TaxID=497108 RepID=UPI0022250721|nr:RSE1 [Candida jiufengensis]KAI5953215.1 RSE1 [Candida jiufengensis]
MLISNDSLYLYNLTLKPPTDYIYSIVGNFIPNTKQQQLILVSSTYISLYISNSETGKLELQFNQNLFSCINAVSKILYKEHDVLVVTGDSGNLSILEYDNKHKNSFKSICILPMCKNGWSKAYPGEYLAVDQYNRCILVSAMENKKLLYKFDDNELLSSPLEHQNKNIVTLQTISLYNNFENPLFVCLEFDTDKNQTLINYYEFDRSLNYLTKRKHIILSDEFNHLIPVPDPIGGVIVCGINKIKYFGKDQNEIIIPLFTRLNQNSSIINHVIHILKKKNLGFFILLQNEFGDLLRLTIEYDHDTEIIKDITVTYFDTIPVSISLNIFKNGFLFANCLNSDQKFYQFENLGDKLKDDELIIKSSTLKGDDKFVLNLKKVENLELIDTLESLSPIFDSNLVDDKLITLSTKSKLKNLQHGISTSILVESPLPILPTKVFTSKLTKNSPNDDYLVITSTLASKTLVLSIGEVIEDVTDSKFILDQPTIAVQQIGSQSIVQVYLNGIRHIKNKKITDWYPPAGITITNASTNNQQILISLSNSEIVYFETDLDDQLIEYQERLEISSSILSLCISKNEHTSFAVIGCSDETIQVISLQQHNCLTVKYLQALSSNAQSLIMSTTNQNSYIHIGMENGVYVRTKIDKYNGKLSDTRIKYLGTKPVQLQEIKINEQINGVSAITSKPWICYQHQNKFKLTPLLNIDIINGTSFTSEEIGGDALIGINSKNLMIYSLGDEDHPFDPNQDLTTTELKLRYMPRQILEFENFTLVSEVERGIESPYKTNLTKDVKNNGIDEEQLESFGYNRGDIYASCVQVITNDEIIQTLEFPKNTKILGITKVLFQKLYLIIAVNIGDENLIYTFRLDKRNQFQYVHKTQLNYYPTVIDSFENKLIIGSGSSISLYELGQKQLLRKSLTKIPFISKINKLIISVNQRILISDLSNSLMLLKFDTDQNKFLPIMDDIIKRQVISLKQLDYDTFIGNDKFGNLFVSRIQSEISNEIDKNWSLLKNKIHNNVLNSCIYKFQNLCDFYIADIITSFQIGNFNNGVEKSIIYTGISGKIGIFIPLIFKTEIELFNNLQMELRKLDNNNVIKKDHLKFRSYYNPIKNIIDGDLIEIFSNLSTSDKLKISSNLKKSINEIDKKIWEIRNRSSF